MEISIKPIWNDTNKTLSYNLTPPDGYFIDYDSIKIPSELLTSNSEITTNFSYSMPSFKNEKTIYDLLDIYYPKWYLYVSFNK